MIQIRNKTQCSGCTACQQVCPHNAISMVFDEDGHSYPKVNTLVCIKCGLCDRTCPMLHKNSIPTDTDLESLPVYAVYNKDDEVRKRSTSGGIFSLIAELIISQGGVVYAARFDEQFHIYHTCFDDIKEIDAFRGSKYAQSWLGDTFRKIKHDLKTKPVLFVGTPCQVAGLKAYLNKEYNNLYTCDFICMGISSSQIWEDYLKTYWGDKRLERIIFKDKREGWHQWKMLIKHNNGEYFCRGMEDPFFFGYLTHLTYRPSCFECPFRTCRRVSDITIADCWGIEKIYPKFDDNKGCTTLILQNQKAEEVFETIKQGLVYITYDIIKVKTYNPYIVNRIDSNPERPYFYKLYKNKGFKSAAEKYCRLRSVSIGRRIINKIKKIICYYQ